MKGRHDGRHGGVGAAHSSQQPSSSRATTANQKQSAHTTQHASMVGTRKGSTSRAGTHQQTKSGSQSTSTATGAKSRQNGGGSISAHRASVSSSNNQSQAQDSAQRDSSATAQKQTAFAQYGLPTGSTRDPASNQVDTPPYNGSAQPGGPVTSTSNLKSAKAMMGNIQIHQKTKSTHLPSSHGYAQMQAGQDNYIVYANANVAGQPTTTSASTKLALKHSRHQSNPSRIILQGAAQSNQTAPSAKVSTSTYEAQKASMNVPKSLAAQQLSDSAVGSSSQASSKPRSKQINQSSAVVGGAHQQRIGSNKFGTQVNTGKIQKVLVSSNNTGTCDNSSVSYSVNTTVGAASSVTQQNKSANTTGGINGHKKSASMANSKITQLLLKAGSKHYIAQQQQHQHQQQQQIMQAVMHQPAQVLQHMPYKEQIPTSTQLRSGFQAVQQIPQQLNSDQQQHQQVFVSSYDVPRRSQDLLQDAHRMPANNANLVHSGINKSMDMVAGGNAAYGARQMPPMYEQQMDLQGDTQLQRILQVDHQIEPQNAKTEQTYQEHLSKYLMAHQPASQAHATSIEAVSRPTSIDVLQQKQKPQSQGPQQPLLFASHHLNGQIMSGQKGVTSAVEKISRQGKVVSSAAVSVKKPCSSHVKTVSTVSQKIQHSTNNASIVKQQQQNQKLGQHGTHQRTKSDTVGSEFALLINMGKVIQNQKGKVGEILKNNFIEAQLPTKQPALPSSMPHTSGKAKISMNIAQQMRTFTGGERSKVGGDAMGYDFSQATQAVVNNKHLLNSHGPEILVDNTKQGTKSSQIGMCSSSNTVMTAAKNGTVTNQSKQKNSKTIQQKYQELEFKYNELLEQLESKNSDGARKYSPIDHVNVITNNQASLSSLSSKNTSNQGVGSRPNQKHASTFQDHQNQVAASQMNPRMIRYINNQMKMSAKDPQIQDKVQLQGKNRLPEHIKTIDQQTASSKYGISTGSAVDMRSADTHLAKQMQKIDLTQMTITHPFEDHINNLVPPNSQQISMPQSQTASQQFAPVQRRSHHNRVNTHYFGQQMADSGVPPGQQNSTANLTREELANHQKKLGQDLNQNAPNTATSGHQYSHSHGHGGNLKGMTSAASGKAKQDTLQHQQQQQYTVSRTLQTPRTLSQSKDEMMAALQRQQEQQRAAPASNDSTIEATKGSSIGVTRHTRMLLQSVLNNGSNQHQLDDPQTTTHMRIEDKHNQTAKMSSGGNHRRSVSDGNDPGNFTFKQQSSTVAPSQFRASLQEPTVSSNIGALQQPLQQSGKQSLARYSMQQRKRLEQSQGGVTSARGVLKGSTRSQSRSKNIQVHEQEIVAMMPQQADVSSIESADQHHLPNQQNLFAQVAQERKSHSKKMPKGMERSQAGGASINKESFTGKKVSGIKKSSKQVTGAVSGNFEKRSVSKGATSATGTARQEIHKKAAHQRLKSNSYRISNKDSSLVMQNSYQPIHGGNVSNHNDPSSEGQIQNPANVVLSGRFIEMATAAGSQHHQGPKVMIKRAEDVTFNKKDRLSIDLQTKEYSKHLAQLQNPPQSQKQSRDSGGKRAFHHPALSQPNNGWIKAQASHDMFIVQENTPSPLHEIEDEGEDQESNRVYAFLKARQGPNPGGLSPVVHQKNSKHSKVTSYERALANSGLQVAGVNRHQAAASSDLSRSDLQRKSAMSGGKGHLHYQHAGGKKALAIEKKRVGMSKNQAMNHPICQPTAVAHHVKNKLSNHSDERKVEPQQHVSAMGAHISNHKRHKSDIVESQRQTFQPLLVTSMGNLDGNGGESKLPQKTKRGQTGRKEVKTERISPQHSQKQGMLSLNVGSKESQQQVLMGTDEFYAAQDQDDDRKMVNISIDDLNDELPSDAEAHDALNSAQYKKAEQSHWIEVVRGQKQVRAEDQPIQQLVEQYNQKKQSLSGTQKEREKNVNEKRKKFMQQYQKQSEVLDQNIQGQKPTAFNEVETLQQRSKNMLQKKRTSNPADAMLIQEPISTQESQNQLLNDQVDHKKYKNIMNVAKRKFKSKSHVPQNMVGVKNSASSLDTQPAEHKKSNPSRLGQYQGIAVDSQENRVNINLNIPTAIQGISDKGAIHGHPNSITHRSLAESDHLVGQLMTRPQKQQELPHPVKKGKGTASKKPTTRKEDAAYVPVNSLELKNLRGIQSQTPQSNKLQAPKASVQQNNFIPSFSNEKSPPNADVRIETYSSIEHDQELTAKEKIRKKIIRYIKLAFENTGIIPATSVDFYRIGKILGKGAFGKVNLAVHYLTSQVVAIKSINKQYFSDDAQRRKVLHEVVILKQTRHKNIVRLFEYFETQKHYLFVIEIAPGGDLLSYVRKRRQLKEDVAKSVFKQLISGLHYCHSKGILHRDIKLDNILLSNNGEVKICDFGVSKVIKRGQVMTEQCGTPAYIAPEILKDRGYEGFGVDIWSSGVVLYAMLYGIVPFRATHMAELQKMIIKAEYKLQDCISKEARDILTGLLEKDPSKRLTTKQIMAHPWMADAKDTVELFTQAEKNYIRSEYTYTDKSRHNRNTGTNGGPEYESDAFVDAALDTNENSILKNAETKSIILAPFNSTKSNIETGSEFLEQVRDLLEDRRIVKFAARVREIAKQYEVNNNAELDNGVQHDFLEEEAKNKAAAEEKKRSSLEGIDADGTGADGAKMLDQLIKNEESLQKTDRDEGPDKRVDPYQAENVDCESDRVFDRQATNSSNVNPFEIGEARNSLAPGLSLIQAQETLTVDEPIIECLVEYGYPREALLRYLNKNELNNATCAYWLLQMAAELQKANEDIAMNAAVAAPSTTEKPAGSGQQRKQKSATVSER